MNGVSMRGEFGALRDSAILPYTESTYHRRSVYSLARQYQHLVRGRALHIGGGHDFWLLQTAQQPVSLDMARYEGIDVLGDALELPFSDNSFDAVVALEVLEHVKSPSGMIGEIHRVLKPGGAVILSTPFVWKVHRTPKDYWRFTSDSLNMLFEGFGRIEVLPVNGARETLMHLLFQYAEVFLDALKLPPGLLIGMKPVEWLSFTVIPRDRKPDRLWTTGWLVIAEK